MKKIKIFLLLLPVLALLLTTNSYAQPNPGETRDEYCARVGIPAAYCQAATGANNPRFETNMERYIVGPGGCGTNGVFSAITCGGITSSITARGTGALPQTASAVTALYQNKPASGAVAIADFKKNMGLPVKEAYAQGFGFTALNPILGLWKIVLNITLVGFVIVFVVIGLMIMLRKQIDPRTVVTIQQALPKIIVSLALAFFSYAICGLIVDATMLATRGGLLVLQTTGLVAQGTETGNAELQDKFGTYGTAEGRQKNADYLLNANVFALFDNLYNIDALLNNISNLPDTQWLAGMFGGTNDLFGSTRDTLLRTVLWIAIFIAMLRVFFMLLAAYVTFVFEVIFSPLRFLLGAIPGSGFSFGSWLRTIGKSILVFPLVFFMITFAAIFTTQVDTALWKNSEGDSGANLTTGGILHQNQWNVGPSEDYPNGLFPPGTAMWAPPAVGDWGIAVGPLIGLGILLTTPRAQKMVEEALTLKPGASEGAASSAVQEAAARIPMLRGFVK